MSAWDEAVKRGLEEDRCPADEALVKELEYLWSDLDDAQSHAFNGVWSMQCDWLTERIVWLTRLTGAATPWGNIPCTLLLNGIYQGILREAGISFEEPDLDGVRELIRATT